MLKPCWAQATMDWESQEDGYVAALLVEDGAKDIAVGSPVLVFVEDKAGPGLILPLSRAGALRMPVGLAGLLVVVNMTGSLASLEMR